MDPFIEAQPGLWKDFHDDLVNELKRSIAAKLPDHYVVRTSERSFVELIDSENIMRRAMEPDVVISEVELKVRQSEPTPYQSGVAIAEIEPVTMQPLLEVESKEVFLEIFELYPERRLVTGIEILSPSNKRRGSEGWDQYDRKRQAMLRGFVNFVEIDLLREGERLPMSGTWPHSPYYLLVSRKRHFPSCKVWPAGSLQPLPPIPIPLSAPDADIILDVQPLVDEIYSRARYYLDINYKQTPASLDPAEAAWLETALRETKA